jgi:VWFA-related protein
VSRILLLLVVLSAFPGFAQIDSESQRLVRLNVSAINAKGEPVTDLRDADIRLREDGTQRPLAFFRFAGSKRPMKLLAAGEVGNRPAPAPTVILLDRWNERITTTAAAWNNIGAALKRLESVDRVYLYFLTNQANLVPVYPLPSTEADLRAAAEPTAAQLSARLDEAVRKFNGFRVIEAQDPILRVNATLQALNALGRQMATVAGRKNLIWVTHGFPLTVRLEGGEFADFTPQVRAFSAAAARTEITIYAVDQSSAGSGADQGSLGRMTLEMATALTGGRWYPSGNTDLALSGAMNDALGSYRLAYRSPDRENGRKEHKIRVESTRKGVRLLTREGYFDGITEVDTDAFEEGFLGSQRRSPFDADEIGLRVTTSRNATGTAMHLAIHVDSADILLERANDNYRGRLTVMFLSYSEGFLKQAPVTHKDLNLTAEQFNKAIKDGLDFWQDLPIADKIDKIRVMVFDRELYGLGSVTVSVAQ